MVYFRTDSSSNSGADTVLIQSAVLFSTRCFSNIDPEVQISGFVMLIHTIHREIPVHAGG